MRETHPSTSTAPDISVNTVIDRVVDAPEFQKERDNYGTIRAFSRTAFRAAGVSLPQNPENHTEDVEDHVDYSNTEITPENAIYVVAAELNSYVHGIEGIRYHHNVQNLDKKTYQAFKARGAKFNHALKTLIDQDTPPSFDDISSTVTTLYGALNGDRWGDDEAGYTEEAKWFKDQFEGTLHGMQHEIVARQFIETINDTDPIIDPVSRKRTPRVEVNSNVSVEDDLRGVDMYVTLDGVTFPIDIKASEHTAKNARKKAVEHGRSPEYIITSGISSVGLDGRFKAGRGRARRESSVMLAKLKAAREAYLRDNPDALNQTTAA